MNIDDKKALRKKLWINAEVQGGIIKRSIFHWYMCTSLILLTVVIYTALRDPSESALLLVYELWMHFSPAILASVFLLPIFIYDILKASNKVAGPLHRLKCEMKKLTDGEQVKPLIFRDGDYWQELADQFNVLAEQVQAERERLDSTSNATEASREPASVLN